MALEAQGKWTNLRNYGCRDKKQIKDIVISNYTNAMCIVIGSDDAKPPDLCIGRNEHGRMETRGIRSTAAWIFEGYVFFVWRW